MNKILALEKAIKISQTLKKQGKVLVLVGGCFDILHIGHLKFLEAAKKEGDILVVALESDENVKKLKGEGRPINDQENRAKNLTKISSVDFIIKLPELVNDADYRNFVKLISPDIIAVTKGDPKMKTKEEQAEIIGGHVKVVIDRLLDFSTTKIVKKL